MLVQKKNNPFLGKNKKKITISPTAASLVFILACCLIAFWPVTFGLLSLKNDATLYFLPVRYQVSEMIRNGHFPFWTPYLHLGYPLYTDMQAGVWNPFVFIISLFGSYTMRSLQFELLIYVYLSGVSMFYLLKYFKIDLRIALLIAVSYMLCGFNTDSSQFAYWISGMAFFPFVFLYYHKMLHQQKWNNVYLFSLSSFLLFVCCYPGELILILYFLFAYTLVFLLKEKLNRNIILKILSLLFVSLLLTTLLSLPAIISYVSSLNYVIRGGKISYELATTNSMHPINLVSYLLPLTVWKIQPQITDLLGRNSYFGLFPFYLLLLSFYYKKKYLMGFLKWGLFISLFFCLGEYGFIREVFYNHFPLMNTFRHPSMARFICIFSGCILSAHCFNNLLYEEQGKKRKLIPFVSILLLIIITPFLFTLSGFNLSFPFDEFTDFRPIKNWFEKSTLAEWVFIELMLQLPLLLIIFFYFIKKIRVRVLVFSSITSIVIHAAILQPVTVVRNESVHSFQNKVNSYTQKGFPFPKLDSSVNSNSLSDPSFQKMYGPVNMFNKKIGEALIFVSPSPLKSREILFSEENAPFRTKLFDYPLLYRADNITLSKDTFDSAMTKSILFDDTAQYQEYSILASHGSYTANFITFSPNNWKFEINSESDGFFCLQQHFYPKWELYIDNKKEKLVPCNISLMGFRINKGKNIVELKFSDTPVIVSVYISVLTFLIIIFIFVKTKIDTKRQETHT